MHMRVFVFASLSALAVAVGCSSAAGSVPSLPTAQPSIDGTQGTPALFYNTNGGGDVPFGEEGFLSFTVQNVGSQDLKVSSVGYTGDTAITFNPGVSPAVPATIPYDMYLSVELTCTPVVSNSEVITTYNGTVTILSNASNLPTITEYVQCVGLPLDGGT
jgi:hypothetical protein